MKKRILCLLLPIFLVGCSNQKNDKFSILASESKVELISNVASVDLSISNDSVLNNHDYNKILWTVNDQENCKIKKVDSYDSSFLNCIWKADFYVAGTYNITATIDGLYSLNSLNIVVTKNAESVSQELSLVLDQSGGLRLGATYDIGLNSSSVKDYSIEGADGVLQLNGDGKLEVIGIDNSQLILKKNGINVKEFYYAVGHSILCTNIKNELIEKGIIDDQSSKVTNEMLKSVTKLALTKELQNDIECVSGLKYLTELEEIDISNNYLSDVSWLSSCTKLKKVNLSNNLITDFNQIVNNQDLEYLDASNNLVNDISKIKFMKKIIYLDLSNNNIFDISDVSTSYGLKSLFLNQNNLTIFTDKLSGLEHLEELGVGNCNIPFSDIASLKYLNNLTYLDISGTDPNLNLISNLSNLRSLILNNCKLNQKNLEAINKLSSLEFLDVSNNDINAEIFSKSGLKGENLKQLLTLKIGGNAFVTIPSLSDFKNLETLDLTNSYNLINLSTITDLKIKNLIIDSCNSLDASLFNDEIQSFDNLEKLSVQGAFYFIDKSNFLFLKNLVEEKNLMLRFLNETYVDKNSISSYTNSVYFSIEELLNSTKVEENAYGLTSKNNAQELIITLANDNSPDALKHYNFNIDKSLFKISIFGNKYKTYDMTFNILDRKNSSIDISFFEFNTASTTNQSLIKATDGSKLFINFDGNCSFKGYSYNTTLAKDNVSAADVFDVYDITINKNINKQSSLRIVGGNGANGAKYTSNTKDPYKGYTGYNGGNGANCIKCHKCIIYDTTTIYLTGGNGGNGGNGHDWDIWNWSVTGAGGDAGNGGNGIAYIESILINGNIQYDGGKAGHYGYGMNYTTGTMPNGNPGTNGAPTKKIY